MNLSIIAQIILGLIGMGAAYFQAKAKSGDQSSAIVSKALQNALDEISKADAVRVKVANAARSDPAGILRDDDGFRRD